MKAQQIARSLRFLLLFALGFQSSGISRGEDAPSSQPSVITQPFTARKVGDIQFAGQPPMSMPTDVTLARDGTLYVADGVNDRVLQFAPDGNLSREISRVGDQKLSRPLGLGVDSTGRIWIADTGNSRVLGMAPDGSLVSTINLPTSSDARPPSITDVASTNDGKHVWLVDNHNHRLVRIEVASGIQTVVGRVGESLGQLNHPFMIALGRDDGVFVSDVLNGRVTVFSAAAQPSTSVGRYGVELGELYRPKGVACDSAGNIWVSDSVVGVIQVFSDRRRFIDVVRDESGQPLHLQSPTGIALGPSNELYVAELGADRVSKFEITRGPVPTTNIQVAAPAQLTGNQARGCTVCHLEWMPPLSSGAGTALMQPPASIPDEPYVSRSENCLSCHDGSMVDSRRRVWQEHGHRTGIKPPASITVPAALPLVDGKIACRTCHSAHVSGQFNSDVSTAVFLRVKNESGELCISCHADKTRGPAFGTHPTGGMPWPVPKNLISAGARAGANPRELTCQVCHTPHGSVNDHLLVLGTNSNELCMSCHDQMRPGMFREDNSTEHPLRPLVNAEQAAAVRELGTKLSDDNRLICLSCHKLHHGKGEHFMLADDLTDGRFCIRCHSEKTTVIGTAHDLRTNFPKEKNRLGMTPQSGGPCSACHMFHRYARAPQSSPIDPGGGKCITCHNPDAVAAAKSLGPIHHPPEGKCFDCHNPHSPGQTLTNVAGDGSQVRDAHFDAAPSTATSLCLSCHNPGGKGPVPAIASHPDVAMFDPDLPAATALPLYDASGQVDQHGSIACATCHIMHGHFPLPATTQIVGDDQTTRPAMYADQEFERILALPPAQRSAMRLMLRPFGESNVCINCHGTAALQRFLYFHDPVRRRAVTAQQISSPRKTRD